MGPPNWQEQYRKFQEMRSAGDKKPMPRALRPLGTTPQADGIAKIRQQGTRPSPRNGYGNASFVGVVGADLALVDQASAGALAHAQLRRRVIHSPNATTIAMTVPQHVN